MEDNASNLR